MKKIFIALIVILIAITAITGQAAGNAFTCSLPDCDPNNLPYVYVLPPGYAAESVILDTDRGMIVFDHAVFEDCENGQIKAGFRVQNINPFYEGRPITVSSVGSAAELNLITVNLVPLPTPAPPPLIITERVKVFIPVIRQ